jgi:hypothetical protein
MQSQAAQCSKHGSMTSCSSSARLSYGTCINSPPLASNHLTILGLYSTPPLNPSMRPYLLPTYDPPGPDLVAMGTDGDVAGSIIYLLFEPDMLSASVCGSADTQDTIFSAEVRDAWFGPTVGRSSERVVVSVIVYNG